MSTALEQGLGGARDPRLAATCKDERRAIVTLDRGLGNIRSYPPAVYHGIIALRLRDQGIESILGAIRRLVTVLESQSVSGAVCILSENRIRVRS